MGRRFGYGKRPSNTAIGEDMPMAPQVSIFNIPGISGSSAYGLSAEADGAPGFTVTTKLAAPLSQASGRIHPSSLQSSVARALRSVELASGCALGDSSNPLFLEIAPDIEAHPPENIALRHLGVTDSSVDALATQLEDVREAWNCYQNFIQAYGTLVLDIDQSLFAERLVFLMNQRGVEHHSDLSAVDLQILVAQYRDLIEGKLGRPFLQDPYAQLWCIIGITFRSGMPSIWG